MSESESPDEPVTLIWDDQVWGHDVQDMDGRSMAAVQMRHYLPAKGRRHQRETELLVSTQRDRLQAHLTDEQLAEVEQFLDHMARDNARLLAIKLADLLRRPLVQGIADQRDLLPRSRPKEKETQ